MKVYCIGDQYNILAQNLVSRQLNVLVHEVAQRLSLLFRFTSLGKGNQIILILILIDQLVISIVLFLCQSSLDLLLLFLNLLLFRLGDSLGLGLSFVLADKLANGIFI